LDGLAIEPLMVAKREMMHGLSREKTPFPSIGFITNTARDAEGYEYHRSGLIPRAFIKPSTSPISMAFPYSNDSFQELPMGD
jgi:hypothetical protein